MEDHERRHPIAALSHPVFWIALALLVLNDHVLKGAGVLPGWITGKLSDFVGLLVAPLVLTALLSLRSTRARLAAFASVGLVFSAINVSPPAARALEGLMTSLGTPWRITSDPTDLIALPVLFAAWALLHRRHARSGRALKLAGLALGAMACIATSQVPDPTWQTSAFVYNRTGTTLNVTVRWVDAEFECAQVATDPGRLLSRESFARGITYRLEADETMPLERGAADGPTRDGTRPEARAGCEVVLLSSDAFDDRVVLFYPNRTITVRAALEPDAYDENPDLAEHALIVDGNGLRTPAGVVAAEPRAQAPEEGPFSCRDYGEATPFVWTELGASSAASRSQSGILTSLYQGIDGCMTLGLAPLESGPSMAEPIEREMTLCVPAEDIPVAEGDELVITSSGDQLEIHNNTTLARLLVFRDVEALRIGPFDIRPVEHTDGCTGTRSTCGDYTMPIAVGLEEASGSRFLFAGDAVERDGANGQRARLRIGRAERRLVSSNRCVDTRGAGTSIDALVVYLGEGQ